MGDDVGKGLSSAFGSLIGGLAIWLTTHTTTSLGPAITGLFTLFGAVGGLCISLNYQRYLGILAASEKRRATPEYRAYDAFRAGLAEGNAAARLYARWLERALDRVARFFGDAGMADRTLFPHAFGLQRPMPLWTAPAFDRCLMIALIYPVVIIVLLWVITGHVGPAEAALSLKTQMPGWHRVIAGVVPVIDFLIAVHLGITLAKQTSGRALFTLSAFIAIVIVVSFDVVFVLDVGGEIVQLVAILTGITVGAFDAGIVAVVLVAITAFGPPYSIISVVAGVAVGKVILVIAITVIVVVGAVYMILINMSLAAFNLIYLLHIQFPAFTATDLVIAVISCISFVVIIVLYNYVRLKGKLGNFLALIVSIMICACFASAGTLSTFLVWDFAGPLLMFFVLLTIVNAPFGWLSLGLTRALLYRGLELGGWYPFVFAIIDSLLAAVIITALALTMVVFVQVFDDLAVHAAGTGAAILPLDKLFTGIATHPEDPKYWWAYALLFSTMIPSLFNLMIGGASLMRGIPGISALLLRSMPNGKVLPWNRAWIAAVLTGQIAIGAFLGIAAQGLIVVGVIGYVMPWFGFGLLDMAQGVAALDLPWRLAQLL